VADFVHLSRAARLAPGPDTHHRLWAAMFELPTWHFVKAPSPTGWMPYYGYVNGLRCVLAFTDAARADGYARFAALVLSGVDTPVLAMAPEAVIQLVPRLKTWGVAGMVVDSGPDSFYAALDHLFALQRTHRAARVPQKLPPPEVPPGGPMLGPPGPTHVVSPAAPPMATLGGGALSADTMLALPHWHVVTTKDDPTFPDLAFEGTELVAQIYSSAAAVARRGKPGEPPPPTAVLPPREVLTQLGDIELVGIVRFDGALDIPFVDLKLRADADR
jgi:hypothetical protein